MARLSANQRINLTIMVAALGYFVDVFDIILFPVVRVESLQALGLSPEQITSAGATILNWQMAGMLLGGIAWGMLGDKRGRVQVLFGTILLYSLGSIANAFVFDVPTYAAARFVTGFGLAGEIGAGITLVMELLPKEKRSYAATIVATCGVIAPAVAALVGGAVNWRWLYVAGGVLGLLLLLLRVSVNESGLFHQIKKKQHVGLGKFYMLFTDRQRLMRYIFSIISATPIWFVVGILVIFTPEIGAALNVSEPLKAPTSVISYTIGIGMGGLLSGLLSQFFCNRKKVMAFFLLGVALTSGCILTARGISAPGFYALILLDGVFIGYWTLFLTTTAELFGTNLRATATTSASNFVRASVIIFTSLITALQADMGFLASVQITAAMCFIAAGLALWRLPETFARDLDFIEG
ncbi:MAG: MFS transporter [Alphaproteobacteria bacterium]|nr:MFS transporter [Alphaproteobacteria bacterium]